MRHRAVRNDPAPNRNMQIGVGIVQNLHAMADDYIISAKAGDRRQRDPKAAAVEPGQIRSAC
jgi:hypothetical protein